MEDVVRIIPVILSGGAGSRLWPASRQAYPKQLLPLVTEDTMIQETAARFNDPMFYPPVFICNENHAEPIRAQMAEKNLPLGQIIIEPEGRNTAPCAIIAALHAKATDAGALVLLAPADHHVTKPDAFRRAVAAGVRPAQSGRLITFGIKPDQPATGYGYIQQGEQLMPSAFAVDAFKEKPDQDVAQSYLEQGGYYWNAGIFLFDPDTLLSEMQKFSPEIVTAAKTAFDKAKFDDKTIRLDQAAFYACPSQSIDYAVMEHTELAAVIPANIGWNDIGSFSSLFDIKKNGSGNALSGDIITHDTEGCLIETDGPIITTVGVQNLAQNVKEIVTKLKSDGRKDLL